MWENFRNWYRTNDTEITWTLIGFLTASGINSIGHHDYVTGAFCFVIAFVNYKLRHLKS